MKKVFLAFLASLAISHAVYAEQHYFDASGADTSAYEEFYPKFKKLFGPALPEKITIEHWKESWTNADHPNNRIQLSDKASPLRCTIAHETSHLAMANLAKGANAWDDQERFAFLDEGFAVVMSNMMCDVRSGESKAAVKTLSLMKARDVLLDSMQRWSSFFGKNGKGDYDTYEAGASFVYYMIGFFGMEKTINFYKSLSDTKNVDKSFQLIFSKDRATVESEWKSWVDAKASQAGSIGNPHFYSVDGSALTRIEVAYEALAGYFGDSVPERFTIENKPLSDTDVPQLDIDRKWIGVPISSVHLPDQQRVRRRSEVPHHRKALVRRDVGWAP